ncbi:DUF1152 domain-containing protein [Peterkaempfera bronchialis]|uniref:DUF1152 domain-containing protein n=1 Tax=Peterkaempfera bronchialis TaxID=2126346 RepID=A0A345SYB6_9ACTN|nr:DUF1152 domain-containing protein [Peterkaempfera bronchialis]
MPTPDGRTARHPQPWPLRVTGLLIAAGGGGDAIAAAIVHAALHGPHHPAVILTYAWDRLAVDPLPGPRTPAAEHTATAAAILDWHPSEATALLVAATRGIHGTCEVRDAGLPVHLTAHSAAVHTLDADTALHTNHLAAALLATNALAQAEQLSRNLYGFSEIDHERTKATRLTQHPPPPFDPAAIPDQLDRFHTEARTRGTHYATLRRIAEALRTPGPHRAALRHHLTTTHPQLHQPPLWRIPNAERT